MAANIDVEKMVMNGVIDLIRNKIFYGHILQQLHKVYTEGECPTIPTMGVGKHSDDIVIRLIVNKDFVKSIFKDSVSASTKDERSRQESDVWDKFVGVLEHEVLHLIFEHLSMQFTDRIRGNIACDLAVNSYIDHHNLLEGALHPDLYNLEPCKGAMWYYVRLKDNQKFKQECQKGQWGTKGLFSDAFDPHKLWDEALQDPLMKDLVRDIVRQGRDLCNRDYGSIPAGIKEYIDQMFEGRRAIVPWQKVLRTFAASAMESNLNYTMKRISKRYGTRPGTKKEDVLNLAVAVDTSGSISLEQLVMFFNEIRWIWKNGAMVYIYECDCVIQEGSPYEFKGKFTGEVKGRGGTDLEPVLKEVEGKYDALIYFTDFYAPSITHRYKIPILWVLTTEMSRDKFPYKWGRFIKIENDQAVPV